MLLRNYFCIISGNNYLLTHTHTHCSDSLTLFQFIIQTGDTDLIYLMFDCCSLGAMKSLFQADTNKDKNNFIGSKVSQFITFRKERERFKMKIFHIFCQQKITKCKLLLVTTY